MNGRCASAANGRTAASARAMAATAGATRFCVRFMLAFLVKLSCGFFSWSSGRNVQRDRAEFARAFAGEVLRALRRPFERHAHDLASAAFACRFDDEPIFARRERGERGLVARVFDLLNAGGLRRTRDAIDGEALLAAVLAPPRAQLVQPLRAAFAAALATGAASAAAR